MEEAGAERRFAALTGDTPALRLLALLEVLAGQESVPPMSELAEMTGVPKPTMHRMIAQLESDGWLTRQTNGRGYALGQRLRHLAEDVLLGDSVDAARHQILQSLVSDLGEACNLTTLVGREVIYLDRVETPEPLRFHLHVGSRVPAHCSASGKMVLSQLPRDRVERLYATGSLERYTDNTLGSLRALLDDLAVSRDRGFAIDAQEYLDGLVCAAVLVPRPGRTSNLCVAVQAPVWRLPMDRLADVVPRLQEAAASVAELVPAD